MPFRGFGVVTLAAAAVPVFLATTLNGASPVPAPDPHAFNQGGGFGSIEPGTNVPPVTLVVVSSAKLRQGDPVIVVNADGVTNKETTTVLAIVDATHIKVAAGKGVGLTVSHVTASLIIVDFSAAVVTVQADAASAAVCYIGTSPAVAVGDPSVIYELQSSPTTGELPKLDVNMGNLGNCIQTGELWIISATGKFVASFYTA